MNRADRSRRAALAFNGSGPPPELYRLPAECRKRSRPRIQSANSIVNLLRRERPIRSPILFLQRPRQTSQGIILCPRRNLSALQFPQCADNQRRPRLREALRKLRRSLIRPNRKLRRLQHRPRIETRINPHRRHARTRLAINDRPLNRRRPAVFRQQRSMHIDPAQPRNLKQARRNNLPVSDNHNRIGLYLAR